MKIKILLLSANPLDKEQLQFLDEEQRSIDSAVRQGNLRDRWEFIPKPAVQVDELQELLLEHEPQIVHFSGHGSPAGELLLQDSNDTSAPVSAAALGNLFALYKNTVRIVVLNACYSEIQGQAISEHIDVVVGMSDAIESRAAVTFASAFYGALGFGQNVKKAFELGCNAIGLKQHVDENVPQLIAPNVDDLTELTLTNRAWIAVNRGDSFWVILATLAGFALIYYWLQISFRFVDVNREFTAYALNVIGVLAILTGLMGITLRKSREAAFSEWERLAEQIPILQSTKAIAGILAVLLFVSAATFHLGLPRLAEYYNNTGIVALNAGVDGREDALRAMLRATRLSPLVAEFHYNLGYIYETHAKDEAAEEAYTRARDLDSTFWPAYNNLARLYLDEAQDLDDAREILRNGLDLLERSSQPTAMAKGILEKNIGWSYLLENKPKPALEHLETAISLFNPDDGTTWIYLAQVYQLLAQAYQADDQALAAIKACNNSEGFALAVRDAPYCSQYGGIFCLNAQEIIDDALQCAANFKEVNK